MSEPINPLVTVPAETEPSRFLPFSDAAKASPPVESAPVIDVQPLSHSTHNAASGTSPPRGRRVAPCHPEREFVARGMCGRCYDRARYASDPEKQKKRIAAWRAKNPLRAKAASDKWRLANPAKAKARSVNWRARNSERLRQTSLAWRAAHPGYAAAYDAARTKADVEYRLIKRLRIRLHDAIRHDRKAGSAIKALGCSVEFLKRHLESHFLPGMSWENWSQTGWHIDHVLPLAAFNLSDPAQFAVANSWTNLRPLWAEENRKKKDKSPREWRLTTSAGHMTTAEGHGEVAA